MVGEALVIRRGKKSRSMRGTRSCGWGRVGQHRKGGSRGGRGRAGLHKHKWSWLLKYAPDHLGKRGFTRHPSIVRRELIINVGEVDEKLGEWMGMGIVEIEEGIPAVDLTKLGYSKVLGGGKLRKPVTIKAVRFSKRAVEKIEGAGGKAVEVKANGV